MDDKKIKNIIVILVFIIFILFFGLGYIVFPNREFSEMENRYLQLFPRFSWQSFVSGDFSEKVESYTADQIVGKDQFVKNHTLYTRMLGQSKINGVYFAKQGYLIQDYQKPDKVFNDNLNYIKEFASENPEVEMNFVIIPNANEIYPEYLPAFATTYSQKNVIDSIERELNQDNMKVIDMTDRLMNHKEEEIFYRTDHHFTSLGAFYTYEEICKSLGVIPNGIENYQIELVDDPFYGSLYSKAPMYKQQSDAVELFKKDDNSYHIVYVNEQKEADSIYDMDYANRKDKYAIFFGGNYALTVIERNSDEESRVEDAIDARGAGVEGIDNQEKVLVIKDSYANSVVPLLADHYNEIHMIDLRYYHEDVSQYIREHEIERVIFIHNVDFISTDNFFLWL